jgi:nitroreductase
MPTDIITLMQEHRSIRKYTDKPISEGDLHEIIKAAQSAATSSHLQCVSVVRVTDKVKREKLVEYTNGQQYVGAATEFLVFCADFHRYEEMFEAPKLGYTEQLLLGAVDAALMGQNAMLAAESYGLGAVFIGAIRNYPDKVIELLELPMHVFPLFGLCLGYPDQDPEVKPRMPMSMMLHESSYKPLNKDTLASYDKDVSDYYCARSSNNKSTTWSQAMEEKVLQEARPFIMKALNDQGFCQR